MLREPCICIFIMSAPQEIRKHKKLSQQPQNQVSWRPETLLATVKSTIVAPVIWQPFWEVPSHFLEERSDWLISHNLGRMEYNCFPRFSNQTNPSTSPQTMVSLDQCQEPVMCLQIMTESWPQSTVAHKTGYTTKYKKSLGESLLSKSLTWKALLQNIERSSRRDFHCMHFSPLQVMSHQAPLPLVEIQTITEVEHSSLC